MNEIPVNEAAPRLEELVRGLSGSREPLALADGAGAVALLVAPRVIQDLEDALAVAGRRLREAGKAPGGGHGRQAAGPRNSRRLPTGSSE
ncbi:MULTISPECIES: type II toxin-antitoxin system prevent-host-death family antitoxin [Streptomyces]|uniref:type II toxin-antitoxin system prevent-host-death family antitoxin n=1 Tax=Streptomyces TaxID=1883 RepID=UPI002FC73B0A